MIENGSSVMNSCGVILSGGKSSRMGTNKSLLKLEGVPVIQLIANKLQVCSDEVCVVTNDHTSYDFLDLDLYSDRYLDKGPLAGLEAALYHVDADIYITAACDMPFVSNLVYNYLIQSLGDFDAVIPVYNERMHPLSGVYGKNILPKIQRQLDNDIRKVRGLFDHINVNYVSDFDEIPAHILSKHFFNMNNPEQYEEAKLF